jgi:hypothetical protein
MRLNLTFATTEDANNFLAKTGETDITNVHVGLINTAVKSQGFVSGTTTGEAIEFLVKQSDGSFAQEVILDPFARIANGDTIEPLDAPIKMLASETWGQTRIENRYPPLIDNLIIANFNPQRRVEVIVMDSGINTTHQEFANATIENLYTVPEFGNYADELMHGTFISSLIVGSTLGVNKQAVIKNVKISSSSRKATLSELGSAFDAIYNYHATCPTVPKILNLSWRMPRSAFIDHKIDLLIDAGVMVVAAAGNTALNIDEITPAGTAGTFVVAGSTESDNELCAVYGTTKKISLYAPGENISGAKFDTTNQYISSNGSSYSAAFASAVASIHFGLGSVCPMSDEVQANMLGDATPGALTVNGNVSATENRLLHRLDASTVSQNTAVFIGTFTKAELTSDPATRQPNAKGDNGTLYDARYLFPTYLGNEATYSLVYDDPEIQSLMAPSTIENGRVTLIVSPDTTFAEGSKIRRMNFKVSMTTNGLTMTSPSIWYFISNGDADYMSDIAPLIEELDLTSVLEFAGFFSAVNVFK